MFLPCDERFFFSRFKVDFQDFYLLFYIFSTAVRDRTLTFIKIRERERGWRIKVPRRCPTLLCVTLGPDFI